MRRPWDLVAIAVGIVCMLLAGSGVLISRWTWPLLVLGVTAIALTVWLTAERAADVRAQLNTTRLVREVVQAIQANGTAQRRSVETLTEITERLLGRVDTRLLGLHRLIEDVLTAPMPAEQPDPAPDWRPAVGYTDPGDTYRAQELAGGAVDMPAADDQVGVDTGGAPQPTPPPPVNAGDGYGLWVYRCQVTDHGADAQFVELTEAAPQCCGRPMAAVTCAGAPAEAPFAVDARSSWVDPLDPEWRWPSPEEQQQPAPAAATRWDAVRAQDGAATWARAGDGREGDR